MSDIPDEFSGEYYNKDYYQTPHGKKFQRTDGSLDGWGYGSPDGECVWFKDVTLAWNKMFQPKNMLDVGCGRGTVVTYARDAGIEAFGFDFSEWAVSDEGRYPRCKKDWVTVHDATKPWPYPDNTFDFLTALDLWEHIYIDDLDFVVSEMFRVANKWIFLQIATVNVVDHLGTFGRKAEPGYILKKGEPVPVEKEGNAVAGHVTVQPENFWLEKFDHEDWMPRPDLVDYFTTLMGSYMNKNWLINTMICLEKI